MARPAKTAPHKSVTQPPPVSRRGRTSKTKAQDTIKMVATSSHRIRKATLPIRRSLSPPSPRSSHTLLSSESHTPISSSTRSAHSRHVSSDALDRLATILEKGFKSVGQQIRQSNHSTFEQLMKYLDDSLNKLNNSITVLRSKKTVNTNISIKSLVTTISSVVNVLKR